MGSTGGWQRPLARPGRLHSAWRLLLVCPQQKALSQQQTQAQAGWLLLRAAALLLRLLAAAAAAACTRTEALTAKQWLHSEHGMKHVMRTPLPLRLFRLQSFRLFLF